MEVIQHLNVQITALGGTVCGFGGSSGGDAAVPLSSWCAGLVPKQHENLPMKADLAFLQADAVHRASCSTIAQRKTTLRWV